jgi:hypothetical protein
MVDGEDPKTDALPEMYQRLLQSDYPEAIALAKEALERDPTDAGALSVLARAERELRRDTTPAPKMVPDAAAEASGRLDGLEDLVARLAGADEDLETVDDPDFETLDDPDDTSTLKRLDGDKVEELDASHLEEDPAGKEEGRGGEGEIEDTGEMTPLTHVTSPTRVVASTATARDMARAFLDSDYPRALSLARVVLTESPGDVMAEAIAKECGIMHKLAMSIPVRVALWDDRVDATEDGVAASLLSLVDGRTSVAEIAAQSGLAPAEAVRLIEEFVASGLLRLHAPDPFDAPCEPD